jgi:MFS family permease
MIRVLQRPAQAAGFVVPKRQIGDAMLALGGMLALASAMGIGRFVYTPILPAMADALGLTRTAAGLIASANFLGYLVGGLLMAIPSLPGGRRAWFVGGLVAGAVTMVAMGFASSMSAFLLLRFVGGIASALVLVIGSTLVLDRLAASGRVALAALHFAGVGVGIAVSALLVGVLQAAGAPWRVLWFGSGAIALVVVPVIAWLVPGDDARSAPVDIPLPSSRRKVASVG